MGAKLKSPRSATGQTGSISREEKLEDAEESAFSSLRGNLGREETGQKMPKTEKRRKKRGGGREIKTWEGGDIPGPTGPELPEIQTSPIS